MATPTITDELNTMADRVGEMLDQLDQSDDSFALARLRFARCALVTAATSDLDDAAQPSRSRLVHVMSIDE